MQNIHSIEIVGAGLAGLLAGNMFRHSPHRIYEAQNALPNNHSAVLRFRTPIVGDTLGIDFKKVTLIKTAASWNNAVADALAYSFKNTGTYRSDRSITAGTVVDERWVAPPDLIARMSKGLNIEYNHLYNFHDRAPPIISTVPMPTLMKALGYYKIPKFVSHPGVNMHAKIANCEAYVSLLVPDPESPISRISITGDELIVECVGMNEPEVAPRTAGLLGLPLSAFKDITYHQQRYAKIAPIDDELRKQFMFWATDKFGIFSLGRFATWRPKLLMDDLVQDVRKIARWINDRYEMVRERR